MKISTDKVFIRAAKAAFRVWCLAPSNVHVTLGALTKPVVLPWVGTEFDVSFGHSKNNPHGLGVEYCGWALEGLHARLTAKSYHTNFPGAVHGGLVACALDEVMGQFVFVRTGHLAVSLDATVEWLASTPSDVPCDVVTQIVKASGPFFYTSGEVRSAKGKVLARARGLYYQPTYSQMQKMLKSSNLPKEAESWFRR